ncbi:hypothetical protein [Streptomyces sp. NBC_01236]|uniref:hypothetical protein n=1 Tax=Streptomyces sp. NBC_01236 TaxID=2903789 RepID=UPI002E15760A|nr:hypothetical protein OG324_50375 [Streptomyces sp. NBC_01236]
MTAARFLTHDEAASRRETLQQSRQPRMPFLLGTYVFAIADRFLEESPHARPTASPGRKTDSGNCSREGRCHIIQYFHAVSIRWIPGAPIESGPHNRKRRLRAKTLHQKLS